MSASPLVPSDLYRIALPSDPRVVAGGRVFYVLGTSDEPTDCVQTAIWSAAVDGVPARFTSGTSDRGPRPSPDGSRLAFVGDRGTGKRVYVVPTDGGEAHALGDAYDAFGALAWSADGKMLAFTAVTPLDAPSAKVARDERTGAMHIRALPYKSDDDGLLDGRRKHLFVIPVSGGAARQVTHGDFDVSAISWSPGGSRIAFCARIDGREDGFSDDAFVVNIDDGSRVALTRGEGPMMATAFSHDGKEIAIIGHVHGDDAGGAIPSRTLRCVVRWRSTAFALGGLRSTGFGLHQL